MEMKRGKLAVLALLWAALLELAACAAGGDGADGSWQEQYDLGVRYLSDGNYQEAVIAFTAAIDIDPKRSDAYVGRGDAYALSGDTEDNLSAAQADYEAALELDETLPGAWLGLSDVYIRRGDYEKAMEILREALEKTGNDQRIADKLAEIESGSFADSAGNVRREYVYNTDGTLEYCYDYTYNEQGFEISFVCTTYVEGEEDYYALVEEFDENGFPYRRNYYKSDGTSTGTYDLMTFNELGQEVERLKYHSGGSMTAFRYFYDESGRRTRYESYRDGEELNGYWVYTYDEAGNLSGTTHYDADGTVLGYTQ